MTKLNYKKLYEQLNKNYINLIKFLYDNHLEILREYESSKINKGFMSIHFLEGKDCIKYGKLQNE